MVELQNRNSNQLIGRSAMFKCHLTIMKLRKIAPATSLSKRNMKNCGFRWRTKSLNTISLVIITSLATSSIGYNLKLSLYKRYVHNIRICNFNNGHQNKQRTPSPRRYTKRKRTSNVDNDQNKRTNQEGQVKNSYKVGQVNKSVKVQFYNKYILVFFLDSFYHHQQQLQGFIKSVFSIHQYNIFEHSAIYHTSIKYYSRESISPTRETDIIMLINKDLMTSGHFNACCRPNGLKTTAIRLLHCDYDLRCLIANGRVKMLLNYISSAHWIQPTGIITLYANYHLHIINKQCCHKNCHCFELLFK
ncbi:hypothetical protein KSF78_0008834 [Schistosoma japonicum]|nr:hypothetical protein KSF78_0008834 [Schistosoma japonicum]